MLYFVLGVLEAIGLQLNYALAILSALISVSLIIVIYYFGKNLFYDSRLVGVITVVLLLFNSSLTFLEFIKANSGNGMLQLIKSWWGLRKFVSWGPMDGHSVVSAYWTWNVYINQKHLIFGFAFVFLILNYLTIEYIKEKDSDPNISLSNYRHLIIGTLVGSLFLWHAQSFISLFFIVFMFFILINRQKAFLYILVGMCFTALPQLIWLFHDRNELMTNSSIKYGYLFKEHLAHLELTSYKYLNSAISWTYTFFRYWFYNIGISIFTITASIFIVDINRKKIFFIFLIIFILANIFVISAYTTNNHKYFNLWIIIGNTYTAYLLYRLFISHWTGKIIAVLIFVPLILSGVIDLAPIKNDFKMNYIDYQKQPLAKWIVENTNPDDVFLTINDVYSPVMFTGRRLFSGYGSFILVSGYSYWKRSQTVREIYEAESKDRLCDKLIKNEIDYIIIEEPNNKNRQFNINKELYKNVRPAFTNLKSRFREKVYFTQTMCKSH